MSEISIVTAKSIRLEKLSENGSRGASTALELAANPSRFFSTVQVGITLIGIFNGAFGEASLVTKVVPMISSIDVLAEYSRQISFVIVATGLTFFSIVFGELVPKRIAMQYPESVAMLIAIPMTFLSRVMSPFVRALSYTTEMTLKLMGFKQAKESTLTEEDIAGMLAEGANNGVFEQTEHEIATRAMRLDDVRLGGLMTPRTELVFIDLNNSLETNLDIIATSPYSRFPVYQGDRANLLGIVHAGDIFELAIRNGNLSDLDIASVTKPPVYVPESISAMNLLETLKQQRAEIAIIVSEYGEIEGLVTLSDVLGALVGDVTALDNQPQTDMTRRQDGSWLVNGGVSFDRFREATETDRKFPLEASGTYHTLAGFIMTELGKVPIESDYFTWSDWRFEVLDMDGNRIDKVLCSQLIPIGPTTQQTEN